MNKKTIKGISKYNNNAIGRTLPVMTTFGLIGVIQFVKIVMLKGSKNMYLQIDFILSSLRSMGIFTVKVLKKIIPTAKESPKQTKPELTRNGPKPFASSTGPIKIVVYIGQNSHSIIE